MSVEIMSKIWKEAPYHGNQLLCLLACADWANDEGDFYPSYNKIGSKLRIERRSAIRLMAKFVDEGIITKTHRRNKSTNSSNLFRLHAKQCDDWEDTCTNCQKFAVLSDQAVTERNQKKERRVVTEKSLGSDSRVTKGSDSRVTHIHHVEPSHEPSLIVENHKADSLPDEIVQVTNRSHPQERKLALVDNIENDLPMAIVEVSAKGATPNTQTPPLAPAQAKLSAPVQIAALFAPIATQNDSEGSTTAPPFSKMQPAAPEEAKNAYFTDRSPANDGRSCSNWRRSEDSQRPSAGESHQENSEWVHSRSSHRSAGMDG